MKSVICFFPLRFSFPRGFLKKHLATTQPTPKSDEEVFVCASLTLTYERTHAHTHEREEVKNPQQEMYYVTHECLWLKVTLLSYKTKSV